MAVSTIRNKQNTLPTLLIYFFGIVGIALVVFFGGELIKNLGSLGGKSGLAVEVSYGDAQVLVNNKIVGKTPFESKSIKPGTNTVLIRNETREYQTSIKFLPAKKDLIYAVGVIRDLGVSDIFSSGQEFWFDKESPEDSLRVISEPSGAEVYLDETKIGVTPFSSQNISSGDYELKISHTGYEPQIARISVHKGYTLNGLIKLFPYPISGTVTEFAQYSGLYDLSSDNDTIVSDTQVWAKAVSYWNQTRGVNIDDVGENKESVFGYFIDFKGNIFDSNGESIVTTEDFQRLQGAERGGYLGRSIDGDNLTKEAQEAFSSLSGLTVSGKTATVLSTPTGWLRVRSAPNLSGTEITTVNVGDTFPVIEEGTGWVKISISGDTQGWVSSIYVELSE
ncbi:MAG: PEGA domain-containing protein [Patescibacteria group bacterium]